MMTKNYQIVLHDESKYPWYGIHSITYNEINEIEEIGENVIFKTPVYEEGKNGIIPMLELAISDAKKYPVLKGTVLGLKEKNDQSGQS